MKDHPNRHVNLRADQLRQIDRLPSLRGAQDWQRDLWEDEVVLWSAFVRAARAVLLMSQTDFARSAGVSRRTVISIENMEKRARFDIQRKIQKYLETRSFYFNVDKKADRVSFEVGYDELRRCVDPKTLEAKFELGKTIILESDEGEA